MDRGAASLLLASCCGVIPRSVVLALGGGDYMVELNDAGVTAIPGPTRCF